MKLGYAIFLVLGILIVLGCAKNVSKQSMSAQQSVVNPSNVCIQACKDSLSAGTDLSKGPCLLDPLPNNPSWVCDVAHNPRQPVDNLVENQCSSYRNGLSNHFVEVSPDCALIRSL